MKKVNPSSPSYETGKILRINHAKTVNTSKVVSKGGDLRTGSKKVVKGGK